MATDPPPGSTVRIEAGGAGSYTDSQGNVWASDNYFTSLASGGTVDRGAITIAGTNDARLFQTERYCMSGYDIPVVNGAYRVKLLFAETYSGITGPGQRVFDVNVGGQALKGLDVFAQAGGSNISLSKIFDNVVVTNGTLSIAFTQHVECSEINGIEIVPASSAAPVPAPTTTPPVPTTPPPAPPPAPTGSFRVSGNKVLSPSGATFIVKGMTPIYGPFAGGDDTGTWSTYSLNNAASIFADLKNNWSGVNVVRIFTSGAAANGHAPADWNLPNYRNLLWDVVTKARAQNFVVLLVNAYSDLADTHAWIQELAARYKSDPYVWITPSNEPFCTSPNTAESSHCGTDAASWAYWQTNSQTFVQEIRAQGFNNPILLDTVSWSWDLSQIGAYPINDSAKNIVYGAHRYNNQNTSFSASEQASINASWANLSGTFPIVADEIGNYNGYAPSAAWANGMVDFLATWVNTRQGAGAIAFNHYWSDGNSMTTNGVTRNAWGNYYLSNFLAKVTSP